MYIQCLGSGDAFGSEGRLNTSFLIRTKNLVVLLDCGATSMAALKKIGLTSNDVDVILISHLHGDHIGGLPFFIAERQVAGDAFKPLTIIGPADTKDRVKTLLQLFFPGLESKITIPLNYLSFVSEGSLTYEQLQVTALPARHPAQTQPFSLRITVDGKVIAYSGDTEWNENLVTISEGSDIFICEGYAFDQPVSDHMCIKTLVDNLDRIKTKKVVLTHLGEDALKRTAEIPFTIANDGEVLMFY